MSGFLGSIGGAIKSIGQSVWKGVGQAGGAIGGAIGSIIGGARGALIGGQIGSGVQQIVNPQTPSYQAGQPTPTPAKAGMCFIATECYDGVPQKFYNFRDRLPSGLVKGYYKISPQLIPLIRLTHSHRFVRKILNILIRG